MSPRTKAIRAYPDLKTWRAAHGLTTREAAKTLGMSQPVYGRLERREQFVKGPQAKRLMEQTNVPLEVLVGAA